ncbi:MAG: TRAP transporter small permease [Pikeienuella sp.]|uniref:TRAP transporter small permease n=1 Tax=Pikeienuella sp. TaxID=2831957 RepID=UPI0039195EA2
MSAARAAPAWSRAAAGAARAHDLLTEAGLRLAMLALAGIVLAYVWEVVARYALGAPTRWSADLVSYLLLFVAFMAMPAVTKEGGHVAVTILLERLSPRALRLVTALIGLSGCAVCLFLAKIAADETARQFARDVRMMAAWPAPKGWISVWVVYGFLSSALYFARAAAARGARG